ncbi:glycosyltransferase family 1 protein [Roseomonas nepalensis]|uniref:Glycosyltransferase family 1 protein n=1 Tax=Muricoccus nepalensis TaxID=1854500 RepID=A0A502GJS7_9PROT|nr:glycosyltransferase [Roseomonas nepalensis]TPG61053.1 glycosyltransferase family 1 protein [Roseomonas nepalensis]
MDDRHDTTQAALPLRAEAARAWHAGRPAEAASLYGRAAGLAEAPWEDLLWQGHAWRAADDAAAALLAFDAAIAEAPAEPLPYLHRGHALRQLGREGEARRAYGLARALDPGAPAAAEAEAGLQAAPGAGTPAPPRPPVPADAAPSPAARAAAPRTAAVLRPGGRAAPALPLPGKEGIAFDVTDLLMHFAHRRTLTGIQRVQASLLGAALRSGADAAYLAFERPRATWRALRREDLARLLEAAGAGADTADPAWIEARDAVPELAAGAPAHAFAEGQVLVNLGNSWGIPDYFRGLRAAQRARGVRYVPFLHDCVPLVMPEHCVRTLVEDYARWFAAMGVHAHGVLCNSEATRADGRRFLDALLPGLDLPMEVVRLDGDPRGTAPPDAAALEGTRAPRPPEPYALFVATIESRKDHLTVLRAWLSLLRRHGPGRIPRLVLVGAAGWGVEAATNLLAGSPELSRHVVVLHGVSDGALSALYRDCLFTVYNSHHEGWGLPVTESMAWGKVPVVPRHSALLESGAGGAVFVEPQSDGDMAAAVERLLFEPGALAAAERVVASRGAPRRWEAVLADVTAGVAAFAARAVVPPAGRLALPLGLRVALRRSDATRPDLAIALSDTIRDGAGWLSPEDWGTPFTGGTARLRLRLPEGAAGALRLHLELRGAGGAPLGLALRADGAPLGTAAIPAPPGGDFAAVLPVELAEGTEVLELEIDAPAGSGLRALMLCRADDLLARLDFLEAQRLPPLRAAS